MKIKFYLWALPATLVFSGAVLLSCVDRDYVVKDVDLGMEIAPGGLKIPLAVIPKEILGERLKGVNNVIERNGFLAVEAKAARSIPVSGGAINAAAAAAELLELLDHAGQGTRANGDQEGHIIHSGELDMIDFSEYLNDLMVIEEASDMVPPQIILAVTNPAPIRATADMMLNLKDKQNESLHMQPITLYEIKPATAEGPTTTRFFIAADGVEPPADYEYEVIRPENFGDFLQTIPHAMVPGYKVGAMPGVEHNVELDDQREYTFGINYEVIFPLCFGSRMRFDAEITEQGMNGVFSGISASGLGIEEIGVIMELETTLQLKIEGVAIELQDDRGEPVPGIAATVAGAIEGPASGGTEARKSTIGIDLSGDIEALSKIYGMKIKLPLGNTAAEGEIMGLRPADFLQGKVWVTLPGGADIDVRELLK